MAIQANIANSQFGIPFNGAYFRIVSSSVMRQRTPENRHLVTIDVIGYATQPSNEDTREVDFRRYSAPFATIESQTGDDFLSKCYSWVMSQSDMVGSVSV